MRRLLRISHLLLVLSAIFALVAFGVLLVRANMELTALRQDRIAMEKQSAAASHTLGLILLRAAVVTDQAAKLAVVEQTYWREQNRQMAKLFVTLNRSAQHFDETVVTAGSTVSNAGLAITEFRSNANVITEDVHQNLQELKTTQIEVRSEIKSFDLPLLFRNLNTLMALAPDVAMNLRSITKHGDKIAADAQYAADKFVAPKTSWEKFKNFMGLFLARSLAYAVGNHL